MKKIAEFARVTPSTASYHLNNLVNQGRVSNPTRGRYILNDEKESGDFSKTFSNFEKTFMVEHVGITLHRHEKNILLEVLSKENKYTPFSATKLALKCKLSVKSVTEYARELEKKGLIEMKKEGRRWVFIPRMTAIKGFSEFFENSKSGRTSSKNSTHHPLTPVTNVDSQPVHETFEEALSWQIFNSHRVILQFKLLRCDHSELKRTAWEFGPKSIHKHLPEAYIFKSLDVQAHKINVLPKKPFIFSDYFEFEDQMIAFINSLTKRLRDYGIIIDLSEPAEIKLEHRALENDEFARRSVRKGVLYFESKSVIKSETGELIKIVTAIDKSSAIHLEFQGTEAAQFATNYGDFVEDVGSGRIDRGFLRKLPEKVSDIDSTVNRFSSVTDRYVDQIESHMGAIRDLSHTARAQTEAAEKITKAVEDLTAVVKDLRKEGEEEPDEEETVTYTRNRAKIPVSIFKKSNLRYKKSNNKTRPFRFSFRSGHWELTPVIKGRIRKTRDVTLPFVAERGTSLKWWLRDGTICTSAQEEDKNE